MYFDEKVKFKELISKTKLLIVDDIGVGTSKNPEWEQDLNQRLIDFRCENYLTTILTCNFDAVKFKEFIGTRNTARIKQKYLTYKLTGESWRGKL